RGPHVLASDPAGRSPRPVGLLAGSGRYPIVFAEKVRSLGVPLVCLGISYEADPVLQQLATRFYWVGIARLGRMIRCFKREGVQQAVMAGKVQKTRMHTPLRALRYLPDWRFVRFWYNRGRRDNRDDSILLGLIAEFAKDGIEF